MTTPPVIEKSEEAPEVRPEGMPNPEDLPKTTEEAIQRERSETPTAERPEHIPEKFWDAETGTPRIEELAKSYAELEKAQGKPEEKSEDGTEVEDSGDEDKSGDTVDKDGDKLSASEAYSELNTRFEQNGEFTEDDYALGEKQGWGRDMMDAHLAGQKALAADAERRIHEAAGGKDNLDRLLKWAGASLSDSEITSYNEVFQSSDVTAAEAKMTELAQKHARATGKNPASVAGRQSDSGPTDVYASMAEVQVDMQKPEYRTNPAFASKVREKLARSKV